MEDKMLNKASVEFQVVEQVASMVMITGPDGAIEYVNPKFTELTGYSVDEVLGLKFQDLMPVDKASNTYSEMWQTVKSGRTWQGEVLNKKKNGDAYWEATVISAIKDEAGIITHYLKTAEDISDRKDVENFKDTFINIISYDLRAPLNEIGRSIKMLYDGSRGQISNKQKDILETARRNVGNLSSLVNEVLDYKKLQAGVINFEKKEADINNILEEVRQITQALVEGKGLEVKADLAAGLPMVILDRERILQVLVNLVNNAVRFTDKGAITLKSELYGQGCIKVSVVDTGIGVMKQDQAKLFQSFRHVSPIEYRKTGFIGLGLAIAKEIIRQHGGKIGVESEPGKGSNFYFILPILDRRIFVRK
jgi:PAS domain S-box-containing protein